MTYSPMHALPFSIRQALGLAYDWQGWGRVPWPLYWGLVPVGWLADWLGMSEELIAIA